MIMDKLNIEDIRKALQMCLVKRECSKCPYYIYYYNDDIRQIGDNSCWGILYKDVDEILSHLEKS